MADTWIIPGGPVLQENEDGATWLVPGVSAVQEAGAAPPPTAKPMWYYDMLKRRNG